MLRIIAISFFATLLAACSSSNRLDEILPARLNAPVQPTMTHTAARNSPSAARTALNAEPRAQPAAPPQHEANKEASKVAVQSSAEE